MRRLLILLALMGLGLAVVHQTQLHKRKDSLRQRISRDGSIAWQEYQLKKKIWQEAAKQNILDGYPQSVNDYADQVYVANITVGTSAVPQVFQVILDTGSANLWIPDKSCDGSKPTDCSNEACSNSMFCRVLCPDPVCCDTTKAQASSRSAAIQQTDIINFVAKCNNKNKFDASLSSTYSKLPGQWSITYGTGAAKGFFGADVLTWGDASTSNPLVVPKTTFGQAHYIASFFDQEPVDGILGLAFSSLAEGGAVPSFIEAVNQGLVAQPLFTVWLEHDGNKDNVFGGVYTWGGLDTDNCGDVIGYAPLTSATYFQFRLQSVNVGTFYATTGWDVISDTGTSLLAISAGIYDSVGAALGGQKDLALGLYRISCTAKTPEMSLVISGMHIDLKTVNLIIPFDDKSCILAIEPYESSGFGPSWILGDPFIRQFCNIYDVGGQKIGFAPSKQQ